MIHIENMEAELRVAILAKIGQLGFEIEAVACRLAIDAAEKITKELQSRGTSVHREAMPAQRRRRRAS